MSVDDAGDGIAVGAEGCGYITQLQFAVEVGLLLFHQKSNAIHQFIVWHRGGCLDILSLMRIAQFIATSTTSIDKHDNSRQDNQCQ